MNNPISNVATLVAEIKDNQGESSELEIYDLVSGDRWEIVEVYQSDDGPHILCFDIQKVG